MPSHDFKLPPTQKAIHMTAFLPNLVSLPTTITTLPIPRPSPTALLIRTTHVSPTHVDLLYCRGLHQNNRRHAKPPFTLGMDFAGTVLHAPATSKFRPGDRVYGSHFGAFAEYLSVPAEAAGSVRRVPRGWRLEDACAVGASGAIGLGSLWRGGEVRRGEWVLVTGATGGLGIVAVQIAKRYFGCRVIGLAGGGSEKEEVLRRVGCDAVVRYDRPNWEEEVREIADGKGVHMVYDGVGLVESALRCCRFGGTVVIVGYAARDGDVERIRANRILLKNAAVVAFRFGETGRQDPEKAKRIWDEFDRMVERGLIKAVVYRENYKGIDDIPRAMNDLHSRKVWGRAVVRIVDDMDVEEGERSRL